MLSTKNRIQAKEDFVILGMNADYYQGTEEFKNTYPFKRDKRATFQWYTNQSFFYPVLNKGLRKF